MKYVITAPDGYITIRQLAQEIGVSKRTMERLTKGWGLNKIKYKNRYLVQMDNHPLFRSIQLSKMCTLKPVYSANRLARVFGFSHVKINAYLSQYAFTIKHKRYWFLSELRDRLDQFPAPLKKTRQNRRKYHY